MLSMSIEEWGRKTLRLRYEGRVDDRVVVQGHELRGLFVMRDGKMRAAEMAPLREMLETGAAA